MEPLTYAEMRRGTWDIDARLRDMDAGGQLAGLCFPSFPRFCGQFFMQAAGKDIAAATVSAYTDWYYEVWAGTHPGRIIRLALVPLWDPQLAAREIRRVAGRGCRALSFSENPAQLGLPSFTPTTGIRCGRRAARPGASFACTSARSPRYRSPRRTPRSTSASC